MPFCPPPPTPARPLLLASRSPRRALLLREAGFDFSQCAPPFADPADPSQAATDPTDGIAVAQQLALCKAQSLPPEAFSQQPGVVALTSDTLGISLAGQLIGTPQTPDRARTMLRLLLGQTHTIVTAVCLCQRDRPPQTFADTATVTIGPVPEAQLADYIKSRQWVGKAGGYNLLERQNAGWPITVVGDPTTVMGLPMQQLIPRLQELGILARTVTAYP